MTLLFGKKKKIKKKDEKTGEEIDQGNRYINNPEMIKNKVEKKTTVPQNIISEDDVKISDPAKK